MIAVYLLLLLPLCISACFCPSCGCTCCSGYSNYYNSGRGYNYAPQSQGSYGYGAPYTIIYQQPIPPSFSSAPIPNAPIPIGGGSIPRSPLPPPPGYAAPSISNPTVLHPASQISEPIPPPRPSYPSDSYDFPALPKSRGYQPPRQVEPLASKPLRGYSPGANPPSPPVTESPVSFEFTTEEPLAHYTGTTRVVPAKKGAHNKDYEYYYVYYDDDGTAKNKKKSGDIKKNRMNDGAVARMHDSVDKKKNEIDEYDFDENWTHPPTTTSVTTTDFNPPPAIVVTQTAPPPPPPPPAPVTIAPIEPSSLAPSDPQDVDTETEDANYEKVESLSENADTDSNPSHDVDAPFGTTIQNVKYEPTTEATTIEEVEWTTLATTSAPTTTTTTTTTPAPTTTTTTAIVTLAPVVETTSAHRLPQNVAAAVTESNPQYEYEEYEVEELQVINENGVTETITRIITTTRPSME